MTWYIILGDGDTYGPLSGAALVESGADIDAERFDGETEADTLRRTATQMIDGANVPDLLATDYELERRAD